jgi:hypothetical protein
MTLDRMKQWVTNFIGSWTWESLLVAVLIFAGTFALSLAIVSFILVKLPPDYFNKSGDHRFLEDKPKWVRLFGVIGKNVLGAVLVIVGVILSIPGVPGQGVLTILLGIMLLDFPGKHRLECKIVSKPKVRDAIDRLRHRFGKPPLELD